MSILVKYLVIVYTEFGDSAVKAEVLKHRNAVRLFNIMHRCWPRRTIELYEIQFDGKKVLIKKQARGMFNG